MNEYQLNWLLGRAEKYWLVERDQLECRPIIPSDVGKVNWRWEVVGSNPLIVGDCFLAIESVFASRPVYCYVVNKGLKIAILASGIALPGVIGFDPYIEFSVLVNDDVEFSLVGLAIERRGIHIDSKAVQISRFFCQ